MWRSKTTKQWYHICMGNSPVNSPHKGQRRGALMFSLICAWVNGWVHNREADDLRHHCAHYDVTVMIFATDVIRIHQCRVECKQISSIELSIGICPDANVWRHVLVSTCSYVSSIQNYIDTSDKRKQPCSEPDRSLWDGGYSIANFSVRKILNLAKAHVRLFESHSYLTGVTTAELRWHLPNISMIFNI